MEILFFGYSKLRGDASEIQIFRAKARRLQYYWRMTDTEKAILQTLLELESAVKSMPVANPKPNLLPLFARLDELTASLPKTSEPDLLHYLHKRSYEKARYFLQGREAENARGTCR